MTPSCLKRGLHYTQQARQPSLRRSRSAEAPSLDGPLSAGACAFPGSPWCVTIESRLFVQLTQLETSRKALQGSSLGGLSALALGSDFQHFEPLRTFRGSSCSQTSLSRKLVDP